MDLNGKVVLVTGGAIRVGRAISLAVARAGADVVINYNSSAGEAECTRAEIEALGRESLACKADVAKADQVEAMVDAAVERFGRLDVLVNGASLWKGTPWPDISEADWDLVNGVAAKGAFLCARAAAPHLSAHGDGAIVNIVDLSSLTPFPGFVAHSAAKATLLSLTYSLAMEMAPNVRVNAVAPGPVLPPPGYTEEQIGLAKRTTLLQRWGTADDVSRTVVFLVESEYITGALIPVDGGEMLAWRKWAFYE